MRKTILAFAGLGLLPFLSPAFGQTGFDDLVSVELIRGWRQSSGTHMAAARIKLAPGWKTYWRAPGGNGIPPRFDFNGSTNLKGFSIHWPKPDIFTAEGITTIGYRTELILPIQLVPVDSSRQINVRANVDFGVCEDICIPVQSNLSGVLPAQGADEKATIQAALADKPTPAAQAGVSNVSCKLDPIPDGFRMTATLTTKKALPASTHTIFEFAHPDVWIDTAQTTVRGHTVTAVADLANYSDGAFFMDRSKLRLTVLGSSQAIDIRGCPAPRT